jgi:hypothetical protein
MRNLIPFLFFILFFSCKREKDKFVVRGFLYKDCSHTIPYANYSLKLNYYTKSLLEDPFELFLNTNDKGEFSFTYESVSDLINGNLSLQFMDSISNGSLVTDLPLNKTVNLGNVVKGSNSFVVYKISTKKPYTENDTLYYRITASNFIPPYKMEAPFKVGPFLDGQILDTVIGTRMFSYENSSESLKVPIYNEWRIGAHYFDKERLNNQYLLIAPCNVYEEVVIDLSKAIK